LLFSGIADLAGDFQGKRRPATENPRAFSLSLEADAPQTDLAICRMTPAMEES
jgi:hypothetical protein